MSPYRRAIIKGHFIEEFYWAGKKVVYVDNFLTSMSYDQAIEYCAGGDNE